MKIKVKSMNHKMISDWEKIFSTLYAEADSRRTPEQMWIAVMAHSSQIGEAIRKFEFERLLNSAAHTFCWLCSFVNKCNALHKDDVFSISESLSGIVSLKYPYTCGHCIQNPCDCDPVRMEGEKDKSAKYAELLDRRQRIWGSFKTYSIDNYKKMFYDVYHGRLHIQTLENIGFHFLEEVGEAAVSVRQLSQLRKIAADSDTGVDSDFLRQLNSIEGIVDNYGKYGKKPKEVDYSSKEQGMLKARVVNAKMDMIAEIGDLFSWYCAILNKLDSISKSIFDDPSKHNDVLPPLEEVLTIEYSVSDGNAKCPGCHTSPCNCKFYNIESISSDKTLLRTME